MSRDLNSLLGNNIDALRAVTEEVSAKFQYRMAILDKRGTALAIGWRSR
jgi:hypothetical protein